MSIRDFVKRTQLLLEQGLYESRKAFSCQDEHALKPMQVAQLEERILMSASPLAVVAESPAADNGGLSEQQFLDLVADSVLPEPATAVAGLNAEANSQIATTVFNSEDTSQQTLELVFIDSAVSGIDQLLQDLQAQNELDDGRTLEVVVLDSQRDGVAQITAALIQYNGIDGMHIVSHGDDGQVQLGSTTLSLDNLDRYRSAISAWQYSMSEEADILIYGCNVAESANGLELLNQLSELTVTDVAGSEDLTGHTDLGGDWDLEYQTGSVSTANAFSDEFIGAYYATLDITGNLVGHYQFEENGGGTLTDSAGNQNGTFGNAASWTADQAVGTYALDFTGDATNSNAYVDVADNAAQDFGSGNFTVGFWYNSTQTPSGDVRLVGDYDGSRGFIFYANGGQLNYQFGGSGGSLNNSTTFLNDGQWHHVALTYDGSSVVRYVNGVSDLTVSASFGDLNTSDSLKFGASSATTADYEGLLDDVRIYQRALDSTDIGELYALNPQNIQVDTTADVLDGNTTDITTLLANRGADGFISLREAIIASNNTAGADTIVLGANVYDLTRTGSNESFAAIGDLDIRSDITIIGAGAGQTTISASGLGDRIFDIDPAGDLTLNSLTLADANSSHTGGAIENSGVLTAYDVVIRDNTGGGSGGAIENSGNVTLERVSLYDNSASGFGGAIRQTAGTLSLTNVVVSGNSTSSHAGGVYMTGGTANVNHSTFADNVTGFNTGGFLVSGGSATISNSIFADNTGGSSYTDDINGNVTSNGYNILEDYASFTANVNDIVGAYDVAARTIDPTTGHAYYAITPGDAAIDPGGSSSTTTDILGRTRDANQDIGAYEYIPTPLTLTVTNTLDDGSVGSLRWAINQANANSGVRDTIEFNIAGGGTQIINVGSTLTVTDEVNIDGTTQTGWVAGSFLPIIIDGNNLNDNGFNFSTNADNSTIRGLVIRDFNVNAIDVDFGADDITIAGNFLGSFDSSGLHVAGEEMGSTIIDVNGSTGLTIGGTTVADRNVIAGGVNGIRLQTSATTGNVIAGNYIGLDATGNAAGNNSGQGILLVGGASGNTIGGATAASANVIAGNGDNSIQIFGESSDGNIIRNNIIGVSADGLTLIDQNDNGGSAIFITNGADDTQILDNLIAGSRYAGIELNNDAVNDGTVIQGNIIGTDSTGTQNWGHGENGILIENATNTTIGGVGVGEGNIVAFSGQVTPEYGSGVSIQDGGTGNTVRGNSIYSNAGTGIDLSATTDDGATPNDAGDVDTGANNLQNWAVLNSVSIADDGTFSYELDTSTLTNGAYAFDFYASTDRDGGQVEGKRYLGSTSMITDGSVETGTLSAITLAPGEYVTLVTTDQFNSNSSEFSNYAVAVDGDVNGATPSDLLTTATTDGGLSINDDGGNDVYLQADTSPFNANGQVTVEVDFKVDTPATGLTTLLSYATGTNQDELYVGIDSGGEVFFRTSSNTGSGYGSTTHAPQLLDGNRHTLTVTWNSTGGLLNFYVDGEELGIGRNNYQPGSTIDAGGTLVIGQHQTSPGAAFDSNDTFEGTIYSARVFSDLRTEAEIMASYRSELPFDEADMLAQWNFDSLSSDGVVTETVSGNNLTVNHTSESGFTQSEAALTFAVDENALDGTVVGTVAGIDAEREAQIASLLAADPDLRYSAETGKFYKVNGTAAVWTTAQTNAAAQSLGGVSGQLVTIRSAAEQAIVHEIASNSGETVVWLGGTDQTIEGEWRWQNGSSNADHFWQGQDDGYNPDGQYHNFELAAGEPNDGGGEDYLRMYTSGARDKFWDDGNSGSSHASVVEWDADAVLNATQAMTYVIQSQTVAGAFAIDASTGQITVADGSLLDFETDATHTVTVRVSDSEATPNTYDEAFTISLNDLVESNNAPTDLSSGIELNSDGGNDAYLIADNGGAILGGMSSFTLELSYAISENATGENALLSYATLSEDNEVYVRISPAGTLSLAIQGVQINSPSIPDLVDGDLHSISISWDNLNGDVSFYIDGELHHVASGLGTGVTLNTGGNLLFGQDQDSVGGGFNSTQRFSGSLYDVRIWDEVRSEAEIALNYQNKYDTLSLPSGLIANWQMDGFNGSNEVVDVVSGNNLNIGHATGTGFIASTPVEDLHISENAADGASVGFVVPSDPDAPGGCCQRWIVYRSR